MDRKIQLLSEGFIARHETFCPRYGWLKKGYDGVRSDGGIFDAPDAIERLGVGKNMVRSIRFWCAAFKMIEPADPEKRRLSGEMRATPMAGDLLADDGWDPYLEDPASLWLLHWLLFTPPIIAPSWSMAISVSGMQQFTVKDLAGVLLDYQPVVPAFARLSPSSFEKDASCFARMYGGSGQGASEEIECPFADLGLLAPAEKRGGFRYRFGDKSTLPDLIFLAACCDYAHHFHSSANAVSMAALAYGFNSPGVVFKLSETVIGNRLERCAGTLDGVVFTESYGNRQLQFEAEPAALRDRALRTHYQNIRRLGI
jgi:hypothetical protein